MGDTESPVPTIVWNPCSGQEGLGDRLRGLASGAVIARGLGARLAVRWERNAACPDPLESMLEIPCVTTFEGESEPTGSPGELTIPLNIMPENAFAIYRRMVPCGVASREEFTELWKGQVREMRIVEPLAEIAEPVLEDFDGSSPLVGIHLRRTDRLFLGNSRINVRTVAEYDRALADAVWEARELEPCTQFFLASDDKGYFDRWMKLMLDGGFDVRGLTKNWISPAGALRQTSSGTALLDMYLLSRCDRVFASCWSSLLFVAEAMGGTELNFVEP